MAKKEVKEVSYTYDPIKDITPVEQYGYIDLVQANLTSSVPASIQIEESKFNGIEEPGAIAGRPRDIFEQAQGSKAIAGYQAPSNEKQETE